MMATAQPIALPSTSGDQDNGMNFGSLPGQSGSFNPASYTRRIIGSPLSWRAGSFGSRFNPGCSPGQLLGPLDPGDFKFGKLSSSIESDHGSVANNLLNVFERQEQFCRDYTCCGQNLTDLHALVEHFEENHVVVVDPYNPQAPMTTPSASTLAAQGHTSYFADVNGIQASTYHQGSFDPDDMELDADPTSAPSSGAPSPPDTPISTPVSSDPTSTFYGGSQPTSACPSPRPMPISAFETTTVLPTRSGHSTLAVGGFPTSSRNATGLVVSTRAEEAFNMYSGYSDYSSLLPGTNPSIQGSEGAYMDSNSPYGMRSACVPTALLFNSGSNTPDDTPASSRVASPAPGPSGYRSNGQPISPSVSSPNASGSSQTPRASTTLSRPASSLLLSKPFRCPKPNCNKSYKQANGLKYHMTHGSCNFAPPKDLEHLQALLASKRSQKAEEGGEPISDAELREVEKEAERRLRPYACGVGECQRRYKNMNGLRYHYQHSGDHGAIGLALLASGQHECLQHNRSNSSSRHSTPASSNAPSSTSSPLATPAVSRAQPATATNYVAASAVPPTYQAASMMPPHYSMQQQQQAQQSQSQQQQHYAHMQTMQMPQYMMQSPNMPQ